jgi:hypothetical protein
MSFKMSKSLCLRLLFEKFEEGSEALKQIDQLMALEDFKQIINDPNHPQFELCGFLTAVQDVAKLVAGNQAE